jgi:hypothetical protein
MVLRPDEDRLLDHRNTIGAPMQRLTVVRSNSSQSYGGRNAASHHDGPRELTPRNEPHLAYAEPYIPVVSEG